MSGESIALIIIALITTSVGWFNSRNEIKKIRLSQEDLEARLKRESEQDKQTKEKADADLATQYFNLAKDTAQEVTNRGVTIKELQTSLTQLRDLQGKVASLEGIVNQQAIELGNNRLAIMKLTSDKSRLEAENSAQRIMVDKLTGRVKLLEDTLRSNNFPVPNGELTKGV